MATEQLLPSDCYGDYEHKVAVDTMVIHHISAINWDSMNEGKSKRIADSGVELLELSPEQRKYSVAHCRALLIGVGLSYHYLIDRDGAVVRLVPEANVAWHAGKSKMPIDQREGVNWFSIGVSLIASHPEDDAEVAAGVIPAYTEAQYESLKDLVKEVSTRCPIRYLVGHDEIAPDRKFDPGEMFAWSRVRNADFSPKLEMGGAAAKLSTITDSAMSLAESLEGVPPECPPEILKRQTLLDVHYIGFDGRRHRGQIVVDERLIDDVRNVFQLIEQTRFPIHSCVPVSASQFRVQGEWSDDASMAANNSSGFAYRNIEGTSKRSYHSLGWAIDLNPLQNPCVKGDVVAPPGAFYRPDERGTWTPSSEVVELLISLGWTWGGSDVAQGLSSFREATYLAESIGIVRSPHMNMSTEMEFPR